MATRRGVKALLTNARICVWSGGSWASSPDVGSNPPRSGTSNSTNMNRWFVDIRAARSDARCGQVWEPYAP
jgi:hypothetical protein